MPRRKYPLVAGKIYHVFNRGITNLATFNTPSEYKRAILALDYYNNSSNKLKFSRFLSQTDRQRRFYLENIKGIAEPQVDIICYCLMPNHFHLLLLQKQDVGISNYLGLFQNSYTRYFNTKNERSGPIFKGRFKSVLVQTDEQLLHVSRYIHLNPYTSDVVNSLHNLKTYPWSSLPDYLNKTKKALVNREKILAFYKNLDSYKKFVLNHADYQKSLGKIKKIVPEK